MFVVRMCLFDLIVAEVVVHFGSPVVIVAVAVDVVVVVAVVVLEYLLMPFFKPPNN